ncbi:MAG TPA: tetratricopeptide repeat protein [Kofleriaceae bacterium]|jgi:hypothetical protein
MRGIIVMAALLAPALAAAEPNTAQAELLFRQGRAQMAAGKLAEACAAFEESEQLAPAPTTLMNLGGCREKQGELATAWSLFLDAERATRTDPQLHGVAQQLAAKLEPRVSPLTISVPPESRIAGLVIARGGQPVDAVLWNQPAPVDGGTYKIIARAGNAAWSTTITIAREGDAKVVHVPDIRPLSPDYVPDPAKRAVARSR